MANVCDDMDHNFPPKQKMDQEDGSATEVTLESIDNHEDLIHIYDKDTVASALKLVCERSGCVFFLEHGNEHCIFNPQSGDRGLNLLGTRMIHNDGEREVGVEELQTHENLNDDAGDETEDDDFEPSTDEESDEDSDTENSSNESKEDFDGYETEYQDSDDGGELDSEVDEGGEGTEPNIRFKKSNYLKYDPKQVPPVFEVGLRFDDIEQVKEACVEYSVFHHRNLWFMKSDRKRLEVKCKVGCSFHMWASYVTSLDQVQITSLRNTHRCNKSWMLKLVSARIAFKFQKPIMDTHRLKLKDLKEKVKSDLKGLIPAIDAVLPNAEHRLCARQVLTNWQRRFPGDTLKSMFWKVAHSTTKRQMLDALDEILTFAGQDSKDNLLTIDPSYWFKAFFNTYIKCDANQNNHCEAFNGVEKIIEARHKAIYSLSEVTRKFVMQRLGDRKKIGQKWDHEFGPEIIKKLEKEGKFYHQWEIIFNGDDAYEVSNGLYQHVVRLLATECSCGRWQLSGIPCCHVICCILDRGDDPISYLDEWYSKERYLLAYNYPIVPIRGPNEWQKSNMLPFVPPYDTRRMPGRPRTQRRLEKGEKKNTDITMLSLFPNLTCKDKKHLVRPLPWWNSKIKSSACSNHVWKVSIA
ncbi:Zinc finger, PMZ-type [Artemisia annua]|uniref:Zinc finger, PMZ-type n=1 Tax=Artemisia annua TaxID=35608 RepID=A0A2U1NY27_ARTAN|nr:Zinc finger, PMZ-type [Artemisia annua]